MQSTTVIIIRHAEKLDWRGGTEPSAESRAAYVDNHKLSPKGYERAHALVGYFTNRREMVEILEKRPLACIIAQDVDFESGWGKSERPKETIWPLLQYHQDKDANVKTFHDNLELRLLTKTQLKHIVDVIKEDEKYINKTVLISWCHQQIPEIVKALGIRNPPNWPKGRYDLTWICDLQDRSLTQKAQFLMFGDQEL